MGSPKGTKPIQGQLTANTTTYLTGLEGPVMLAYGASELRITGFVRNVLSNFGVKPRYRKFAVRPETPNPAAWTEGTAVTADGQFSEDFDLSSLGAFMWIQPALGAGLTAGSAGEGFAMMQAWTNTEARIVARQTVVLLPYINATQNAIIPLGEPFPAFDLSGVMVAIAARGVSGSPSIDIVTRTFTADPSIGSAWDTTGLIGTDKTFSSTTEDYNTGNLPYAPANVAFAQLGLYVPAVNANATFDIIIAAKY